MTQLHVLLTHIDDLGPPEKIARSRPPPEERRGAAPGETMAGGIGRCHTLKLGHDDRRLWHVCMMTSLRGPVRVGFGWSLQL